MKSCGRDACGPRSPHSKLLPCRRRLWASRCFCDIRPFSTRWLPDENQKCSDPSRRRVVLASILLLTTALAQTAKKALHEPCGRTATGTLLPNGWTLTPEGEQITVSQLPLNMVLSPDGRYLLSTTNGYGLQQIDVIDVSAGKSTETLTVRKSWLDWPSRPTAADSLSRVAMITRYYFDFAAGHATEAGRISLGSPGISRLDDRGREARRAGRGSFSFRQALQSLRMANGSSWPRISLTSSL